MIEKNDIVTLQIERMAFGGKGVGTIDGMVCFVPGTLPGETVKVKITGIRKNHVTALPLEVIEADASRVEPVCPFALTPSGSKQRPVYCPGCAYQHVDYQRELELKDAQFRDFLERSIDDFPCSAIESPLASPEALNYRNKIVLHTYFERGNIDLGYFLEDNQTVLDIDACPLADAAINETLSELRADPGFKHTLHDKMRFTLRYTPAKGVLYWRNNAPAGASWLKQETCIGSISVPMDSFFQVNSAVCDLLIQEVVGIIERFKPGLVIDLYCGVGLFSAAAASAGVEKVVGLDVDGAAVKAAEYNLAQRNCQGTFITGKAEKLMREVCSEADNGENPLLIVDPPRNGLARNVCHSILNSAVKGLVYISCGPDTLARDLKILTDGGFKLTKTRLIDMFPRTSHFETITLLER